MSHWGKGFSPVVFLMIVALVAVLLPTSSTSAATVIKLREDPKYDFYASGRGDETTTGSISSCQPPEPEPCDPSVLTVANPKRWRPEQGVRVRHAGRTDVVHTGEPPDPNDFDYPEWVKVDPSANETRYSADRQIGDYSVLCSMKPDATVAGTVDICGLRFNSPKDFSYDELDLWVKSSRAMTRGDLRFVLFRDEATESEELQPVENGDLEFPAVAAGSWTKALLRIQGEDGVGAVKEIRLRCTVSCTGIEVNLDQLELLQDLVGIVGKIEGKKFHLKDGAGNALFAKRTVTNQVVFHDDTRAVRKWLETAEGTAGPHRLFAPAGIYYISRDHLRNLSFGSRGLPLFSDTTMFCRSKQKTTFRNAGGSATGVSGMFVGFDESPRSITVRDCGFDANGWNRRDFLSMLDLSAKTIEGQATNIRVLNNLFSDSDPPGPEGCDISQNQCSTLQRQYVLVQGAVGEEDAAGSMTVPGAVIENNILEHGGRIKAGGHEKATWIFIRNNKLDFINDNGITVVQIRPGVTRNVLITSNTVKNAIGASIFFGSDGEELASTRGMETRDILVAGNRISGFFGAGVSAILPEDASNIEIRDNRIQAVRKDRGPADVGAFPTGIALRRGVAKCSDGRDNDGDGFTDAADSGCTTANDNDEATDSSEEWFPNATRNVVVDGNAVLASERFGLYRDSAILFDGPLNEVTMSGNTVGWIPCPQENPCPNVVPYEKGIRLRRGPFTNIDLSGNTISEANIALLLGDLSVKVPVAFTNTFIHEENTFLRSRNSNKGQITLWAKAGESIRVSITGNVIDGGQGFGVLCEGGGAFSLVISMNRGSNAESVSGCGVR